MTDTSEQQPEGELLAAAIAQDKRSVRQIAADVGISDTRLRHVVNGYQPVGRGQRIPAIAPADTLARIAHVLDITPEQLEGAGRADAATTLRTFTGPRSVPDRDEEPASLDVVMRRLDEIDNRISSLERRLPEAVPELAVAKIEELEEHSDFPET